MQVWLVGALVSAVIPFAVWLVSLAMNSFCGEDLGLAAIVAVVCFISGGLGAAYFSVWWAGPIVALIVVIILVFAYALEE